MVIKPHLDTKSGIQGIIEGFIEEIELQRRLPLCRRTLASHRKHGKIPYVQVGRRILYHWPTIEQTLLRQQRAAE